MYIYISIYVYIHLDMAGSVKSLRRWCVGSHLDRYPHRSPVRSDGFYYFQGLPTWRSIWCAFEAIWFSYEMSRNYIDFLMKAFDVHAGSYTSMRCSGFPWNLVLLCVWHCMKAYDVGRCLGSCWAVWWDQKRWTCKAYDQFTWCLYSRRFTDPASYIYIFPVRLYIFIAFPIYFF